MESDPASVSGAIVQRGGWARRAWAAAALVMVVVAVVAVWERSPSDPGADPSAVEDGPPGGHSAPGAATGGESPVRLVAGPWPSGLRLFAAPYPQGGGPGRLRPAYLLSWDPVAGALEATEAQLPLHPGWWRYPVVQVGDAAVFATRELDVVRVPLDAMGAFETVATAASVLPSPQPGHVRIVRNGIVTELEVASGRTGATIETGQFTDLAVDAGVLTRAWDQGWTLWTTSGRRGLDLPEGSDVVAAGGDRLLVVPGDGSLRHVHVVTGAGTDVDAGPDAAPEDGAGTGAALSPNGRLAAVVRNPFPACDGPATVTVVDAAAGDEVARWPTRPCPSRPVWVDDRTVVFELAEAAGRRHLLAVLRVGAAPAVLQVTGDRWWVAAAGQAGAGSPENPGR